MLKLQLSKKFLSQLGQKVLSVCLYSEVAETESLELKILKIDIEIERSAPGIPLLAAPVVLVGIGASFRLGSRPIFSFM